MLENPRRLVFHLYIPEGETPEIYKYHFACIKYFSNIFNEFVIVISTDNLNDEKILKYKQKFLPLCKNITFKVIENKEYREVQTFKDEILDKLEYDNSFTFFAHSKGTTNEFNDSLITWICYMYYFCLRSVDKVNEVFTGQAPNTGMFYGPMAFYSEEVLSSVKYHWHYPGAFYWVNMLALHNYSTNESIPKIDGRSYAENFPGNIVPLKDIHPSLVRCRFAGNYFIKGPFAYDLYYKCPTVLRYCFSENDLNELNNFIEHIKNNLEEF